MNESTEFSDRRRSKRTSVCEMLLKAAAPALIIVGRRSARFGGHQFPMAQLSHVAPQSHIFTSYKLRSCCRERGQMRAISTTQNLCCEHTMNNGDRGRTINPNGPVRSLFVLIKSRVQSSKVSRTAVDGRWEMACIVRNFGGQFI